MDKNTRRSLRASVLTALAENPGDPRKTALVYIAITSAATLLVDILLTVLANKISQTSGLGSMGTRTTLSTISSVLPIVQMLLVLVIHLGYQKATMKVVRRQTVAPATLKEGLPALARLIRATLLMGGLYLILAIFAMYAASFIFSLTPLSNSFYDMVLPLLSEGGDIYTLLASDPVLLAQVAGAILPVFPIFVLIFVMMAAPFYYGYRMMNYCLLDERRMGARRAMRESARMMKGHRLSLLKMDLSFWWYFLAQGLIGCLLYYDVFLSMLGVALPWSEMVSYYIFLVLYLVLSAVLCYFCMNRVETTYAAVYDHIRPKTESTQGVVLGNIFDLAKDYKEE